jgi:uncharacterized membrane protein
LEIGDWHLAEIAATIIESLGVLAISLGVAVAAAATVQARLGDPAGNAYEVFRRRMSRWLLLGLELLIAADVITTVTLEIDLASVAALGVLVIIRTFLAWSITMEDEGRWPWQRAQPPAADSSA